MIRVECVSCGKGIKAPEKYAGKTVKCPGCEARVKIPAAKPAAVPAAIAPAKPPEPEPEPQPKQQPATRDCPFCAEPIAMSARKCKHCGEILDPELAAWKRESGVAPPQPATQVVVNVPQQKWSPGVACLLSFLIPGAGQMYKGQPINGIAWFVLTIVGYLLFIIPGLALHICCMVGAASGDPSK